MSRPAPTGAATEVTAAPPTEAVDRPEAAGALRPRRPRSADAVLALAYGVLLVLPGEVALVGPLRSNGTPLRLLGLVAFVLVLVGVVRLGRPTATRPVAAVVVAYLAVVVFSWGTGHLRPLTATEAAQIDRSALIAVSGAGLALLAASIVRDLRHAHRLAGLAAAGAVLCVAVGALQYVEVVGTWPDLLRLPFTTTVVAPMGAVDRLGLNRVPGTTSSPLEYSVVLAVLLPLLVHLVVHAGSRAARAGALLGTVAVLLGLPLGFSRSGLLTLAVTTAVLLLFLRRAHRWTLLVTGALAAVAAVVTAPAITGTLALLVSGAAEDDSIQGRLLDYPRAMALFESSPWVGYGPSFERWTDSVLDNQWLGTLVRDGVVGVAGLAVLLVGGALVAAWSASRQPAGSPGRSLDGALCAGLVGVAVAAGTFDVLSFQTVTFVAFLLLGLVGAGASDGDRPAPEET